MYTRPAEIMSESNIRISFGEKYSGRSYKKQMHVHAFEKSIAFYHAQANKAAHCVTFCASCICDILSTF
jgi:hypothetical protein